MGAGGGYPAPAGTDPRAVARLPVSVWCLTGFGVVFAVGFLVYVYARGPAAAELGHWMVVFGLAGGAMSALIARTARRPGYQPKRSRPRADREPWNDLP